MSLVPTYPVSAIPEAGRPRTKCSSPLATKAWVRHLLNRLPDIRDWALATDAGRPKEWDSLSAEQKLALSRLFQLKADGPAVHLETLKRRARDFDPILSAINAVADGSNPFEKRYAYGESVPKDAVSARLEVLLPGSSALLSRPPPPFDPWLYVALDFVNPWTGWLFLVRQISPSEVDPACLASDNDGVLEQEVNALLSRSASTEWKFDDDDASNRAITRFSSDIIEATACAVFPSEATYNDSAKTEAIFRLERWCHATSEEREREAAWPPRAPTTPSELGLTVLTNAIAAYRLSRLVRVTFEAKWHAALFLRVALDSIEPQLDALDHAAFYRPKQGLPAIQTVMSGAGYWPPRLPQQNDEL